MWKTMGHPGWVVGSSLGEGMAVVVQSGQYRTCLEDEVWG